MSILSGCSKLTSSKEVTRLFLANNNAEGYPTSVACDEFARLVKERTNGRIIIETYHNSVLADEPSCIEQIQVGGIDFARVGVATLAKYDDSLNALQLPYLYRDEEHMWNVLNGEIGQSFLNSETLKEKGIMGLAWYTGGSRNFYNTHKEIHTPEDLVGMKVRVLESKLNMGMVSAMGGEPKPMNFADVYNALEKGTLDAAENNWASYISSSHYKVAKYITVDEHLRIPEIIIASKKSMEKLSEEDQKIIAECAKESTDTQLKLWKNYEEESVKTAEEAGCHITYLTADQVSLFQKSVENLYETEAATYKDIIDAIAAVK
ncbi:TRAP transporter substrate-binding protein [Defluviitalea raffinosedens]|nr:TRAP transporter substrate-binding protein [Defluviitalea raffinosedens]